LRAGRVAVSVCFLYQASSTDQRGGSPSATGSGALRLTETAAFYITTGCDFLLPIR
jgi:hypothetical protein